ncbi:hypothetical protein PCASD_08481 [Puccinia coronata f. sp. avenae]|uniref:DUF6589 domain-containing protein n=1 Tax=Puccinia coronata f. sp. avenae TaxID=200324 RepID=A0A2N5UY48_9BASI|nr:hypothetical protein PCASD_08481 [Puccinia coronata f. sp. avenae]
MSQPTFEHPDPPRRYRSEESKITAILDFMASVDHDPKSFIISLLRIKNDQAATQRRYWRTQRGWNSTLAMLHAVRDFVCTKEVGKVAWEAEMLCEATRITVNQKPPGGCYPNGEYYSSKQVNEAFFDEKTKLMEKSTASKPDSDEPDVFEQLEQEDWEVDENGDFFPVLLPAPIHQDYQTRARKTATTICSMIAFVHNRRINGTQLANSLTFLASGVSERVNHSLNYIGLTSSRRTAHRALEVLGKQAEDKIKQKMSTANSLIMPPFLCIDNLDFEQRVHAKSIGHDSKMFHGTWGYIHQINPKLLASVSPADLTLEAYQESMQKASNIKVTPTMFIASVAEDQHWTLVLKSQIADAITQYVAESSDNEVKIITSPPAVDQISHEQPDITMLKLMVASDNSAQGFEDVCTGIIQQTNLSETKFASRLLMLDGDLGTCVNVKCLQNQRFPSAHVEDSLENVCPLLGASHTLWNIGHAIYTKYFGNSSDSRDSGAWRYLESLGIPSRKTLDKKDFTLMISNMIKIHEATLVHCVMQVMEEGEKSLDAKPHYLPSKEIQRIIDLCYTKFFSAESRVEASQLLSPKLANLQLRLLDFASIVEANAAMKAGDIGRVMYMWKLAPTGRQKHFSPKDLFLEKQNYWLKYFFNHSGRGTEIDRLKDVYSVNVPFLQSLIQGLNIESGSKNIIQSHHNKIKLVSLNNCLRMVRQNDSCGISSKSNEYIPEPVPNFYAKGVKKISSDYRAGRLNRLRPPPIICWDAGDLPTQNMDSDGGPSSESSSEEEEDLETSTDEDDSSDDEDLDGSEENSG